MPIIDDDEWAAIAAHLESLETQVSELTAQVDFLLRERVLHTEGREALLRMTNPVEDLLEPLPPGYGRGNAGQVVALTYEAGREMARGRLDPTPRKRSPKAPG